MFRTKFYCKSKSPKIKSKRGQNKANTSDDESGTGYGYMWAIIPDDFEFGPGFFHTGLGVHQLVVLPEEKIVYVFRMDTDKDFVDPGDEALMELFFMIMDARVAD